MFCDFNLTIGMDFVLFRLVCNNSRRQMFKWRTCGECVRDEVSLIFIIGSSAHSHIMERYSMEKDRYHSANNDP